MLRWSDGGVKKEWEGFKWLAFLPALNSVLWAEKVTNKKAQDDRENLSMDKIEKKEVAVGREWKSKPSLILLCVAELVELNTSQSEMRA